METRQIFFTSKFGFKFAWQLYGYPACVAMILYFLTQPVIFLPPRPSVFNLTLSSSISFTFLTFSPHRHLSYISMPLCLWLSVTCECCPRRLPVCLCLGISKWQSCSQVFMCCVAMCQSVCVNVRSQQRSIESPGRIHFPLQPSLDDDWESSEEWQPFITQWTQWTHVLTPVRSVRLSLARGHSDSQPKWVFWTQTEAEYRLCILILIGKEEKHFCLLSLCIFIPIGFYIGPQTRPHLHAM